jgi:hypothetical protein
MFSSTKLDKIFGIDDLKESEDDTKTSETFKILEQLGVKEVYVEPENVNLMASDAGIPDDDIANELNNTVEADLEEMTTELSKHKPKQMSSVELVYEELNELIRIAKKILKAAEYLVDTSPDGESISGTASLINAVRNVIKEFTDLHRDSIKYEKMKELERFKVELKKELMEHKRALDSNKNSAVDVPLVEYSQEELVKTILKMQKEAAAQNLTNSPSAP